MDYVLATENFRGTIKLCSKTIVLLWFLSEGRQYYCSSSAWYLLFEKKMGLSKANSEDTSSSLTQNKKRLVINQISVLFHFIR
jgi:hypothetical protein